MKVTVKGILHWTRWSHDEEVEYIIAADDMSACSSSARQYANIKPVSVEVEMPDDFDPIPGIVKGMRDRKQNLLAEAQMEANKIDGEIQQLLSITYKPEEA